MPRCSGSSDHGHDCTPKDQYDDAVALVDVREAATTLTAVQQRSQAKMVDPMTAMAITTLVLKGATLLVDMANAFVKGYFKEKMDDEVQAVRSLTESEKEDMDQMKQFYEHRNQQHLKACTDFLDQYDKNVSHTFSRQDFHAVKSYLDMEMLRMTATLQMDIEFNTKVRESFKFFAKDEVGTLLSKAEKFGNDVVSFLDPSDATSKAGELITSVLGTAASAYVMGAFALVQAARDFFMAIVNIIRTIIDCKKSLNDYKLDAKRAKIDVRWASCRFYKQWADETRSRILSTLRRFAGIVDTSKLLTPLQEFRSKLLAKFEPEGACGMFVQAKKSTAPAIEELWLVPGAPVKDSTTVGQVEVSNTQDDGLFYETTTKNTTLKYQMAVSVAQQEQHKKNMQLFSGDHRKLGDHEWAPVTALEARFVPTEDAVDPAEITELPLKPLEIWRSTMTNDPLFPLLKSRVWNRLRDELVSQQQVDFGPPPSNGTWLDEVAEDVKNAIKEKLKDTIKEQVDKAVKWLEELTTAVTKVANGKAKEQLDSVVSGMLDIPDVGGDGGAKKVSQKVANAIQLVAAADHFSAMVSAKDPEVLKWLNVADIFSPLSRLQVTTTTSKPEDILKHIAQKLKAHLHGELDQLRKEADKKTKKAIENAEKVAEEKIDEVVGKLFKTGAAASTTTSSTKKLHHGASPKEIRLHVNPTKLANDALQDDAAKAVEFSSPSRHVFSGLFKGQKWSHVVLYYGRGTGAPIVELRMCKDDFAETISEKLKSEDLDSVYRVLMPVTKETKGCPEEKVKLPLCFKKDFHLPAPNADKINLEVRKNDDSSHATVHASLAPASPTKPQQAPEPKQFFFSYWCDKGSMEHPRVSQKFNSIEECKSMRNKCLVNFPTNPCARNCFLEEKRKHIDYVRDYAKLVALSLLYDMPTVNSECRFASLNDLLARKDEVDKPHQGGTDKSNSGDNDAANILMGDITKSRK